MLIDFASSEHVQIFSRLILQQMFWNNILETKIELLSPIESYIQPFFETIKLHIIVSYLYRKSTLDCMETPLCLGFRLSIRFGQEYFFEN